MSKPLVTMAQVAKHNTREDAWVAYKGKAYDLTNFLANHPGGEEVLVDVAGRDATLDFDDVGHSDDAIKMLIDMFQGEIVSKERHKDSSFFFREVAKVVDAPNPNAKPADKSTHRQLSYVDADKLDRDLECVVCLDPLFEPVDFQCGRMACKICADEFETCPTCGEECKIHSLIRSKFVLNPLNDLKVVCLSCDQNYRRQDFLVHKPNCLIDCPQGCNERIEPNSITIHFETCSKTQVECEGKEILCQWRGTREDLTKHLEECPFLKIRVPLEALIIRLNNQEKELEAIRAIILELIAERQYAKIEAEIRAEAQKKEEERLEQEFKKLGISTAKEIRDRFEKSVRKGDLDLCRLLVEKGANVNAKDECREPLLHKAAINGYLEVCKLLVEKGADLEARDCGLKTSFHLAAENGHLEVCKFLIEKGSNINARDKHGYTSLHWAAQCGRLEVCEWLVEKGANLEAISPYGETPLHLAATWGRLEVCKFLLAKGAVRDERFTQLAQRGWNI